MSEQIPCMNVYVVWHPQTDGADKDVSVGHPLARRIYSYFARDIDNPMSPGLGIPVYFRSTPGAPGSKTPLAIDLNRAESCAVIVLASSDMVTDEAWSEYVSGIGAAVRSSAGQHRMFPVSLSKAALELSQVLGQTNFICYHEFPDEQKEDSLTLWLTHELCRFLNRPRTNAGDRVLSPKPIRLFISHAKQDGVPLAETFRESIKNTPAAVFFDSIDIAPGYDFGAEIEENIRESTLLVLQSDAYSSRPWCRQEVLIAKRLHRPIIVVNALEQDERRSFPYLGNVPVIRWTGNNQQRILHSALREHLRFLFTELRSEVLKKAGRIPAGARVLMRAPEILDCQTLAQEVTDEQRPALVVYPDPPLGAEEEKIISSFAEGMTFTTFIMPAERMRLSNRVIGLSISESSDLASRGLSETHLRDALIEFTRQFLARDASVAYAGDLRAGGFTQVLFDLVRSHNSSGTPTTYRPIRNYLAWPLHLNTDTEAEAALIRVGKIYRGPLPADLAGHPGASVPLGDSTLNRYVKARCLTAMRRHMNSDIQVRVLLGGGVQGYQGRYPGLLEEAYLALTEKKPLFLLGAFGGCTEAIIELIEGGSPESLTFDFQCADESYREFAAEYNRQVAATPALGLERIDYEHLANTFRTAGINGLGNGLSVEENRLLFSAADLDEIIYLVLKGLGNLFRG